MIRLFTALEIPDEIAERLVRLQRGIEGARWIEQEDFHITLRFIGDIPEDVADDVDAALAEIPFTPFELELEGVGAFGGTKPHAVWAGVKMTEPLKLLQQRHESAIRRAGPPPETRNYTPHVTLARLRGREADEVYRYIEANNLFASPRFEVTRAVLFSSRASTGGGPYVVERTYPDETFGEED
ncbi:RNA 2',3'-cyclic phosphodiesterase [Parvibaculum sedimenti]|uniref:RNA 2',3'-cyclic phosphodiesterase n=1 Tax=Parvibaculum sedimenti TaxID=2608632 RepID=A0A6N6VNM7_9HYPH|nr:RNA 2',3'-cyclic phosphodiesterase [Parvibaculum sedimenti]KAB7742252.1 RNA 2',3'-cyclic phosphodiesterase [Parvibaculum sedimenti]